MYVLKMTANYELLKQNSYYITMLRIVSKGLEDFKHTPKKQSIFQYSFVPDCSFNDFRQT